MVALVDTNPSQPLRIGVVIPTLGTNDCLDKSLSSIAQQTREVASVVVVDQSHNDRIATICNKWSSMLPILRVHTHPGASHARNTGLNQLVENVDIVGFLDDDCTYAANCFEEVQASFHDNRTAAISGRLNSHESRLRFGDDAQALDYRTVWTMAIEATMFCRISVIDDLNGFNEELGIGSSSPWQSGEGTDLLLRMMGRGYEVHYQPKCEVTEHDENASTKASPALKSRKYGRGTGRVYRMHYSWLVCIWQVIRPLLGAFISLAAGNKELSIRRLQAAIGRWEGITGWLTGRLP